jgi:hypothetical protein
MIVGGIVLTPLSLPLFSLESTEKYIHGITFGAMTEVHELTGDLRYMHGWPELVEQIADIYQALPEEEQAECVIFASNYAIPGAIDLWRDQYGLPPAISTYMSYQLWGPGERSGEVVIAITHRMEDMERLFGHVEEVGRFHHPKAVNFMQDIPILICRHPKVDLRDAWAQAIPWE